MGSRPLPPLYSTRAHDPDAESAIDAFIFGLGEAIDALQDAEAAGDASRLGVLSAELAMRARELGFPPVASAAEGLRAACAGSELESARKAVEELTELAQRVRRGHRSFAS